MSLKVNGHLSGLNISVVYIKINIFECALIKANIMVAFIKGKHWMFAFIKGKQFLLRFHLHFAYIIKWPHRVAVGSVQSNKTMHVTPNVKSI